MAQANALHEGSLFHDSLSVLAVEVECLIARHKHADCWVQAFGLVKIVALLVSALERRVQTRITTDGRGWWHVPILKVHPLSVVECDVLSCFGC